MIHKFRSNGLNIVLDINSGSVHVFDDLAYKILDYYPDENKIFASLNSYSKNEIDSALTEIKKLESDGLLFTEDFTPPDFDNYKPVIKAMCLHVAHACNLKCRYCFAEEGSYHGKSSLMSLEVGQKAIDFLIKNSANRKNLEVDFFGGEPLLNFDVVKQIVDYARNQEQKNNKKFRFTMTTNGVLLDDQKIDYLDKNMYNVVLSIDGRKKINDSMRLSPDGSSSYDKIMPNFKKFVSVRGNKNYYVRGTFTHNNLDFVKDILHLNQEGFDQISIEPVVAQESLDYALNPEDKQRILKEYDNLTKIMLDNIKDKSKNKKFNFFHFMIDLDNSSCFAKRVIGCGAATEYLAVAPNGNLYPCHQFVGNKDFKMGNILESLKSESNKDKINKEIRDKFNNCNIYTKAKCKTCWAKFYCSGGCSANAYNFNKDIYQPHDYACDLQKKRMECALAIKAFKACQTGD